MIHVKFEGNWTHAGLEYSTPTQPNQIEVPLLPVHEDICRDINRTTEMIECDVQVRFTNPSTYHRFKGINGSFGYKYDTGKPGIEVVCWPLERTDPKRLRLIVAHELGHAYQHDLFGKDRLMQAVETDTYLLELFADDFAEWLTGLRYSRAEDKAYIGRARGLF